MSVAQFEVRRTGWDVVIGALLAIAGLVILAYAAFWTQVSVLFMGWMLVAIGLLALVASFFRIGKGGFWSAALTGGLLGVLGLFMLTNTEVAAVTLTLLAGVVFLAGGVVRLAVAAEDRAYRVPLIFGGIVQVALGLIVLFNLFDASFVLLGVLLGVEVLVEGITMMLIGRWHVTTSETPTGAASTATAEMPGQRRKPQEQRRPQPH
jgi:uncharacterized membrane protein HdeD (DUF308 family)